MTTFQDDELALLSNPQFFEQNLQATEKLKRLMEQLRTAFLEEIHPHELLAPIGTDFLKGQIANGENYEGYPYVMLDFPKHFGKANIFTSLLLFRAPTHPILDVVIDFFEKPIPLHLEQSERFAKHVFQCSATLHQHYG